MSREYDDAYVSQYKVPQMVSGKHTVPSCLNARTLCCSKGKYKDALECGFEHVCEVISVCPSHL